MGGMKGGRGLEVVGPWKTCLGLPSVLDMPHI